MFHKTIGLIKAAYATGAKLSWRAKVKDCRNSIVVGIHAHAYVQLLATRYPLVDLEVSWHFQWYMLGKQKTTTTTRTR